MTVRVPHRAAAFLAALILLPAVALAAPPPDATLELRILHINDVYEIAPQAGWGGMAELMTLLEEERKGATHHLTTLGGDLLSPSILSALTKGEQMIRLTNAIGVQMAVLGNHEFDFGLDVLLTRVAESRYPWIGGNVRGPGGKRLAKTHDICLLDYPGFRVGIFGVLTPETKELASLDPGLSISDPFARSRELIADLRERGADVIIGLTHLTMAEDLQLVAEVEGIDLVIGGHDHEATSFHNGKVLIHKSGHDGHFLGVIDLKISRVAGEVSVVPAWKLRPVHGVPPHAATAKIVAGYTTQLEKELGQPVGKTDVLLDAREAVVREKESALGNLIADVIREAGQADAALFNGGGIRSGRQIPAGTELTRRDVLSLLPFGDVVVVLAMPGHVLRAALEHGFGKLGERSGRFPQISGIEVVVDPKRPVGERVTSVKVGGKPLKDDEVYRVASGSYVSSGGDGYAMLKPLERLLDERGGLLLSNLVAEHVEQHSPVAPTTDGRITFR